MIGKPRGIGGGFGINQVTGHGKKMPDSGMAKNAIDKTPCVSIDLSKPVIRPHTAQWNAQIMRESQTARESRQERLIKHHSNAPVGKAIAASWRASPIKDRQSNDSKAWRERRLFSLYLHRDDDNFLRHYSAKESQQVLTMIGSARHVQSQQSDADFAEEDMKFFFTCNNSDVPSQFIVHVISPSAEK